MLTINSKGAMKKYNIYITAFIASICFGLTSCGEFNYSEPHEDRTVYQSDREATEVNTTIADVKEMYKNEIANSTYALVEDDLIFDGYVMANDISGNLYQGIFVRKGNDAIQVGINDNSLWAKYPVGTHVVVHLKGLYVGGYGRMAKVGMPYITSSNDATAVDARSSLGGMLKQVAKTNVVVIGYSEEVDEVKPVLIDDNFLKNESKEQWAPMFVKIHNATMKGIMVSGEYRKVFAVYDDRDNGNGVNDQITIGSQTITMRQSALANFSSDTIPEGQHDVVGVLTRYNNDWQFQLRSREDILN